MRGKPCPIKNMRLFRGTVKTVPYHSAVVSEKRADFPPPSAEAISLPRGEGVSRRLTKEGFPSNPEGIASPWGEVAFPQEMTEGC